MFNIVKRSDKAFFPIIKATNGTYDVTILGKDGTFDWHGCNLTVSCRPKKPFMPLLNWLIGKPFIEIEKFSTCLSIENANKLAKYLPDAVIAAEELRELILSLFSIRKAAMGDEAVLAFIQTESWKAAFKDILSDELLVKYTDIGRATEMYKGLLQENKGNGYILSIMGKPHYIAWWDASREKDMPGYAELICIHSLQEFWGHGYGGKMMGRVLSDIAAAGYSKVMLWVFEDNERARKFYEAKGFHATDKVRTALGVSEICYEFTGKLQVTEELPEDRQNETK